MADDPDDLCAHGHIHFQINETVFVDASEGDWTVSGCALYLLRTIEHNNDATNSVAEMNFIFPCCASNVWKDNMTKYPCYAQGCFTGKSPMISHRNGIVEIEYDGVSEIVSKLEWATAVYSFADQVENFYQRCTKKNLLEDKVDAEGWEIFWNEWAVLKRAASAFILCA